MSMKIVITCGGTGGHITPALAIADTLRQNVRGADIRFVGGVRGLEGQLVTAAGYSITLLQVRGLRRSLSPSNLGVLWEQRRAIGQAASLLRAFGPDIVIGTGGYACYPTLRAAVSLGIVTAVHESNAVPGLAVRRLAGKVDRVWVNFAAAAAALPRGARVLAVGNPTRGTLCSSLSRGTDARLRVLSFGGSLGADALNAAVLDLMEAERRRGGVCHLHAAGREHLEAVRRSFTARGLDGAAGFTLVPFIEDMALQMAQADLVICRAGAMSISELAMAGCAAVLVPSPHVTGDHQRKNARVLEQEGAAVCVEEEALPRGELTQTVLALLDRAPKRQSLSAAITAFATPDANARILADVRQMVEAAARRGK